MIIAIIMIIQKSYVATKSSDNPSSVANKKNIIWQSQIRLKIPSHQHVAGNTRALRRIIEMKKIGFEVVY